MPGPAFPKTGQEQSDYRRRSQPPVEEYFHVVPNPGRQLRDIWNDEAQSEWQIKKQQLARHEIVFALPQESRYQQRNKKAGVLKPEPEKVLSAAIPAELPREKRPGADGSAMRGPQQLRNCDYRSDQEKQKPLAPAAQIN